MPPVDPVALTADLIRCPSVTPEEGGALDLLAGVLGEAGFTCVRADRGDVGNLLARWGEKGHPDTFGFNGHVDVVPPGDESGWTHPPFAADIADGHLWGRGACDMKSGVAAFVAAAVAQVQEAPPDGAILLAITGDEEGPARDGTAALLDHMSRTGERMDVCLVGEPTCPDEMGEVVKIGRRGSLNAQFTVTGVQGHAAYPHRALNPLPAMMRLMDRLSGYVLDAGTAHFDPSTLAVVTVDTGNPATNVIPADCRATINIRFNDAHDAAGLADWLRDEAAKVADAFGTRIDVEMAGSSPAFLTPPGALSDLVCGAVEARTGRRPVLSTSGGTSDARFLKDHCPVVEFGLVGRTMHQTDERVPTAQIAELAGIYREILARYFA